MSYILDALKKAERERGIAQVPTLATVHEAGLSTPRRNTRLIAGAAFVCAALVILAAGIFLSKTLQKSEDTRISKQPETVVQPRQERPPEAVVPIIKAPAGQAAVSQPEAAELNLPEKRPAVRIMPVPLKGTEAPARSSPAQPLSSNSPTFPVAVPPASAADVPHEPVSLQKALAKMNMTILMYAENASERIVFINDRKYMEGDYVDGSYLLENITPEGAVLTFQGERATLRPRAR